LNDAISRFATPGGPAQAAGGPGDAATFWTMLLGDGLLAAVYLSAAAFLLYLYRARARRGLRHRGIVAVGAVFFMAAAAEQATDLWTDLGHDAGAVAAHAGAAALAAAIAAFAVLRLSRRIAGDDALAEANRELKRGIAERERIERELAKACEEAQAANRAKTEFLAHMSHELRTPLNAILGFSQVIAEEMLGPRAKRRYLEYVRDIQHSGEHLLGVVNDLLEFSRLESGTAAPREGLVDVAQSIADAARVMEPQAREAGLAVTVSAARDLPPLIADARMTKQMLMNLLTNAIKFTPQGGEVRVSAALGPEGGIVLAVADTGVGIPANDIPRALEAFGRVRAHQPRGARQGFGLGLPICKALAELHGARLEIDSAQGRGTTARIVFPARRTQLRALAG
jgi:signal transduction histidine kinase